MCYETILSGWVTFTRPPLQMRVCSLFTKLLFCISISSCSLTLKEKINVTSFSSISYYSNVWDWSHVYFTVVIQIPSFITPIRNLFFHGNLKYPLPLSFISKYLSLFKRNEHLNKDFYSRLNYFLWGTCWIGESSSGCSLMLSQWPLRSLKLYP